APASAGDERGERPLAFDQAILYKPPSPWILGSPERRAQARHWRRERRHGCTETKNLALAPGHAALRRCAQEADLCRGQGFGRVAPAAPHRSEDRHVQGPANFEASGGDLRTYPGDLFRKPVSTFRDHALSPAPLPRRGEA